MEVYTLSIRLALIEILLNCCYSRKTVFHMIYFFLFKAMDVY